MNNTEIIAYLDDQIARLEQVKLLLTGDPAKRKPGLPGQEKKSTGPKKRTISAEGRARIAAAQKARWAKSKKGA